MPVEINTWNHTVNEIAEGDKAICLCPDAETAARVAQALENEKDLEHLVRLCRELAKDIEDEDLSVALKPFEAQFKD